MINDAIELAKRIAFEIAKPGINAIASNAIERLEKPLVEAFPVLRQLRSLRLRQVEQSLLMLQERLKRIEITTEGERLLGFANMCFRYFETGAREHRDVKLRMLAATCAHSADNRNEDSFDEQLEFLSAVDTLQPASIRILHYLYQNHVQVDEHGTHKYGEGATRDELEAAQFFEGSRKQVWLLKSLRQLLELGVVRIQGGYMVMEDGFMRPIVEPDLVVALGRVQVAPFGCYLLQYLGDTAAIEVDENQIA